MTLNHCNGLYEWCECKCGGGTRGAEQRSIEGLCPHCVENIFSDSMAFLEQGQRAPAKGRKRAKKARRPAKGRVR